LGHVRVTPSPRAPRLPVIVRRRSLGAGIGPMLSRLVHLLALTAMLVMPVEYRGGADESHPHPLLQVFADALEPDGEHHHDVAAIPAAPPHRHRDVFELDPAFDDPGVTEVDGPAAASIYLAGTAPPTAIAANRFDGPRVVPAAESGDAASRLAASAFARTLRVTGVVLWLAWAAVAGLRGLTNAPAFPPPRRFLPA